MSSLMTFVNVLRIWKAGVIIKAQCLFCGNEGGRGCLFLHDGQKPGGWQLDCVIPSCVPGTLCFLLKRIKRRGKIDMNYMGKGTESVLD